MFPDLDDDFENWWMIHKFELMQDEAVGVREIARAAWDASRASARPLRAPGARRCSACKALLEENSVYCDTCGTDALRP